MQLLGLAPSITVSRADANIDAVSEMYSLDLPKLSNSGSRVPSMGEKVTVREKSTSRTNSRIRGTELNVFVF